jgi:MoxR-like ATPase
MNQQEMIAKVNKLLGELDKNIFGYRNVKLRVIFALLADGHVLLEGLPGLAKTLLISTLQSTLGESQWRRVQMTSDLQPSDIIGVMVYNPKTLEFEYRPGPIVGINLALIDEINRATPKNQGSLLEAMQERQVSVEGVTRKMEQLFLVLATQNPIEQEGTFPLPEAQQDRFCFKLIVDYASREDELAILDALHVHGRDAQAGIEQTITVSDVIAMRKHIIENVRVKPAAKEYIVDLVRCTRPEDPLFKKLVKNELQGKIKVGASPRAQIWLYKTAKVRAFLAGRDHVLPEDVKAVAKDILRHRIILTDEVIFDGFTTDEAINIVLNAVPVVEPKTK